VFTARYEPGLEIKQPAPRLKRVNAGLKQYKVTLNWICEYEFGFRSELCKKKKQQH